MMMLTKSDWHSIVWIANGKEYRLPDTLVIDEDLHLWLTKFHEVYLDIREALDLLKDDNWPLNVCQKCYLTTRCKCHARERC